MAAVRFLFSNCKSKLFIPRKFFATQEKIKKGIVLGAYTDGKDGFKLTHSAEYFNKFTGELEKSLCVSGIKKGKVRTFYRVHPDYDAVAVVGLGKIDVGFNDDENIDEKKEDVRIAAGLGCRALQDLECTDVDVEDFGDAEAAAEGAALGMFVYQDFKQEDKRKKIPIIKFYGPSDSVYWSSGIVRANAQNLARRLADAPGNYMTPTMFCEAARDELCPLGIEVWTHDRDWAMKKKMGAFLSVTHGSCEPCQFLEMTYQGGRPCQKPIILVGKGVTFDTGGISLKPAAKMDEMRADMGGAACVVAALQGIAYLKLPINVIGLAPLCENMPSGQATKPGDIVCAMNGKYIQVDNTDAEGRLILADALCYASTLDPRLTIDIATLTGAMRVALGGVVTGIFTNSTNVWEEVFKAGCISGDRVWRFPLYKAYTKRMTEFSAVDLNNVGKGTGGGACTAAAFLKEFAPKGDWMHMDIAGVMGPDVDIPYLQRGMTGRPTRTLIQLLYQLSCS